MAGYVPEKGYRVDPNWYGLLSIIGGVVALLPLAIVGLMVWRIPGDVAAAAMYTAIFCAIGAVTRVVSWKRH